MLFSGEREVDVAETGTVLSVGAADTETAAHLAVPVGAPVAEVRRVCSSPDGTVVYLGEVTYRGDYVHYEMDLKP